MNLTGLSKLLKDLILETVIMCNPQKFCKMMHPAQILKSCSNDQEFCFYRHQSLFLKVQPKFHHYQKLKTDLWQWIGWNKWNSIRKGFNSLVSAFVFLRWEQEQAVPLSNKIRTSLRAYSREVLLCRPGGHGILIRECFWMQREVGVIGRGKNWENCCYCHVIIKEFAPFMSLKTKRESSSIPPAKMIKA